VRRDDMPENVFSARNPLYLPDRLLH